MEHKTAYLRVGAGCLFLEIFVVCVVRYQLYARRRKKYLDHVIQLEAQLKFKTLVTTPINNSTDLLADRHLMSVTNVKQLRGAYRHPFEYISPKLYMIDEIVAASEDDSILFVSDENEYREQVREFTVV